MCRKSYFSMYTMGDEGERNSPSEEHGVSKETRLKASAELEIERLTGAKNVTEQMGDDQEVKKKLDEIEESLNEKKEELEDFEALNQALVVKEQRANVELTDARKELIDLIKKHSFRGSIGVKRMGERDSTRFREITKSKFLGTDADLKATQLCSIWAPCGSQLASFQRCNKRKWFQGNHH
ncbi:hypothetical protein MTR67_001718 [Solanum verrucosum]|uniref:Factor of DNA methylation 1-5/IDN2 domain-containing protein n=1 Tax=Solanum verrucosum TaxID=315347 RepID=A0AAF0T8P4_SOLVR|nr:hypothetical protein MTR67_001718 [Solanum verrucosum]